MSTAGSAAFWRRLGLLALCVLVRLAALSADPPFWLSWSTGLYTDEGYYTLDARHEALFGGAAPGNFHDRLLSPLLSAWQQAVFSVFGAGLQEARLLSVAFGLLTVAVFWLGLRRAYDARTADLGALFLGLAPPFALYNRLALQETPTVFWLALAFALWAQGGRLAGFLSGAALGIGVVFKGLAVLGAAVIGIPPARSNRSVRYRGTTSTTRPNNGRAIWSNRAPPLLGAGGTLLLYYLFWYWPHYAELTRMATFYRVHQMQPHSAVSVWLNIKRGLVGGERGVIPYLLAQTPVPCLLTGLMFWKRRVWTQADWYLALWLAGGLIFCLLSSYAPSRYYVLFLPPLAGHAARGLADWKRPFTLAAAGVFCVTSLAWFAAAWTRRTETRLDSSQALTRLLPPGSIVIGEFAPALCLGTPFAAAPVQPGLSNDDHPVERLHGAVIVVTRTAYWQQWWQARYPGVIQPSHKIATFTLGGSRSYVEDVYRVK